MDAPLTPGGWRYDRLERATDANFRSPANQRLVSLSCLHDGQVSITVRSSGAGPVTIRSETAARALIANQSGGFSYILLSATDPLLDAMALSKGRFAVEVEGLAPLILPSHAEVSRVIEDCR